MSEWWRSVWGSLRYRLTHGSKFPKGDLISFLLALANRGFEPTHILDVGANRGKWSSKARRVFPKCAFTLIEPQREMSVYLDAFCQRASGTRWINAGAGAEMGTLDFMVSVDLYLNETTRHADVILPGSSPLRRTANPDGSSRYDFVRSTP